MTLSNPTVVLITGASRGIGRTLVETFLLRPNHIVIGTVRNTAADYVKDVESLPKVDGSRLQLIKIESSNSTDPATAINDLVDIDHIDVVIANAGGAGEKGIILLDVVSPEVVTEVFTVNALGPLALYQAVKPLLEKSSSPKWVSVTSAAGSIGRLELHKAYIAPAYGIAKAGLNWITTAIHSANKEFIAFAVHPGERQQECPRDGPSSGS
ncbi:NAD(P)-binding protein [Aspergillus sclerotioniger CBS 115572]|uniref:NAD(P)-binding protein n=1 Tax=Aspergillus sclerotioniger CBS 115572 TaxID=1450535 RepID=A0A317W2H6_9EURO|nr:NAD(P)-binding protein [Aspergillus sclerotioniger CBS 115572]PWY80836.1 NAD(P)-binding protein [Aspergillus sclerotioniger CBS 115572]